MVADDWRVIVVRAWRDGAHIRVRLLVQNAGQRTWVVTGADEALKILGTLLHELDAPGGASVAGRLRAQLWAHHLGVGPGTVLDPLASRQLWDVAPSRDVCPYDPKGGSDPWSDYKPDMIIDPSDRRPGDPCETLLRAPA